MIKNLNSISFFSGIEGFGVASQRLGVELLASVEIDPFCNKILKKNFPHIAHYGDIKKFNDLHAHQYTDKIDIITGGFPCQPFSYAGKRKGTDDHRHLFPEFERSISIIKPRIIVAENVSGLATTIQLQNHSHLESESIGSTTENYLLPQIKKSIENLGYEVAIFDIPASSVEANHIRQRLWIVAHRKCEGLEGQLHSTPLSKSNAGVLIGSKNSNPQYATIETGRFREDATNASGFGDRELRDISQAQGPQCSFDQSGQFSGLSWVQVATQLCGVDDALSAGMDVARLRNDLTRLYPKLTEKQIEIAIDRTYRQYRTHRIKALGNAIVPDVAYYVLKAVIEYSRNYLPLNKIKNG